MTMFELINTDAFSSLWYWVFLSLVWTRVTHAPMGLPIDSYTRARGAGPDGEDDAFALIRVSVARQLAGSQRLGVWLVGGWAFLLSLLAGLAIGYGAELAQALLCLLAPLAVVQMLITRTAAHMAQMPPNLPELIARLYRLRLQVQIVALASLFVTAVFGMMQTLSRAVF